MNIKQQLLTIKFPSRNVYHGRLKFYENGKLFDQIGTQFFREKKEEAWKDMSDLTDDLIQKIRE